MTRILIAVITGGRPRREDRPTDRFLAALSALGDVEYVVREDQAGDYVPAPGIPLNVYPVSWADQYARTHWRHPRAVCEPGGFHGAFTGREWAMRSAEDRGYDLVLQLDDNILTVGPIDSNRTFYYERGEGVVRMARIMVEVALSTNISMLGFQLNSSAPQAISTVVRPGYPYSFFLEKTGPGRMPYYGPFEDDIMHALEYSLNGGPGRTAGLIPTFMYAKESASKTGMRKHYNAERGLELVRRYPKNASLIESRRTSSPNSRNSGDRGIRHLLNTKGFTPVWVTDRERYGTARYELVSLVQECRDRIDADLRTKIAKRAGKATP